MRTLGGGEPNGSPSSPSDGLIRPAIEIFSSDDLAVLSVSEQLVVIGLDGVRLDIVERFRDDLPVLDSMLSEGASGPLESVLPGPHSGPAWTSFSTGLNPGKHGIGDWRVRDGYEFLPASGDEVTNPRFWDYLSENDLTSGVFNIPLTSPPRPIDGVVVSSWTSSVKTWTSPPEFQAALEEVGYQRKADFASPDDPLEALLDSIEARRRGFERFMDRYDWDCFVGMFYETEQAHHQFATLLDPDHPLFDPTCESKVRRVYEKIDEQLGVIRDRVPTETTMFVMSDHGFCPLYERVYLNRILEDYSHYKPPDGSGDGVTETAGGRLLAGAVRRVKTNGSVRSAVSSTIELPVVGPAIGWVLDKYRSIEYRKTVAGEWAETTAFNGYEHGGIFINTMDEPEGIVPPDERDAVVRDVIDDLRGDEFLSKRVDGIYERSELFDGEKLDHLPEIIIDFADGYLGSSGYNEQRSLGPEYFASDDKNVGFHTMNGLLVADGPMVAEGCVTDLSILDIAPTVLHFFDAAVPENMDGEPMWDVFEPGSDFCTRSLRTRAVGEHHGPRKMSETELAAVESQLNEMGYK